MIEKQIKDLAWNTFKQTGDINTFMELMQVQKLEENRMQNQLENVQKFWTKNELENR